MTLRVPTIRKARRAGVLPLFLYIAVLSGPAGRPAAADGPIATITDRGSHYAVTLDMASGATHRQLGEAYGRELKRVVPGIEPLVESYVSELMASVAKELPKSLLIAFPKGVPNSVLYGILMARVKDVMPQVPAEYREEMDGIASQLSGGSTDVLGDGKLSADEVYGINLLADVGRPSECSAVSVFGARSATGKTIVARNFDWPDTPGHQALRLQAVTTIKNGARSLCMVGFLGCISSPQMVNRRGVFAALLDAGTGAPYSSQGKRSYIMDLRTALEQADSVEAAGAYLADPGKQYAFNHLVFLADAAHSAVLENNLSGTGTNMRRCLRTSDAELNDGVPWGIPDAVGAVNCFMVKGSHNGYTRVPANTARWESMRRELLSKGPRVSPAALREVICYHHAPRPGGQREGDLFNAATMQSMLYDAASGALQVFFRPKDGSLPGDPTFETVPLGF